jgi:hypothetical protein
MMIPRCEGDLDDVPPGRRRLSMSSKYLDQSRSPVVGCLTEYTMGYFLKDKEGLLTVKDSFNLSGSIISCRDMQANAGIWCPMHLCKSR